MTEKPIEPLPRIFVDFNTAMGHPEEWVVFTPAPEDLPWLEVGRRVLLEETPTVEVDGIRYFASREDAGYESLEVEAVLRFDTEYGGKYGYWEAEPDWSGKRYMTYPVCPGL